jgi:hypothetical protein
LIFTKDTGRKDSWFNYLHKGDHVLIISKDVIKTEQGLKVGIIISVRKPDDGSQVEVKVKAPKVFCYTGWGFLMSRKHGGSFSKVHASTFDDWNTIWLVPGEANVENILF